MKFDVLLLCLKHLLAYFMKCEALFMQVLEQMCKWLPNFRSLSAGNVTDVIWYTLYKSLVFLNLFNFRREIICMCFCNWDEILEFRVASFLMGFLFPLGYLIESCALKIEQKDAMSGGANFPDIPRPNEDFL